jgi:hypothetical protein
MMAAMYLILSRAKDLTGRPRNQRRALRLTGKIPRSARDEVRLPLTVHRSRLV